MEEVKRIFQPEFRNRLTKIVVFHAMDDKMAEQIVTKKLDGLQEMLAKKKLQGRLTVLLAGILSRFWWTKFYSDG